VSTTTTYDVAIVGLGAMGSAAAQAMSRRGLRVLGLDRYRPPHTFGSSHGESRIIREAYFERPLYVPLVRQAYARWREIQAETGRPLLRVCGGISIGSPQSEIVTGARASAQVHQVPYEELSAAELQHRFPAWRVPDSMIGIWDPGAGILDPEACVTAMLDLAKAHGAQLLFDEPVLSWESVTIGDADAIRVRTAQATYSAKQLVITTGGWARDLLTSLDLPLTVERNAVHWFAPAAQPESLRPDRFPLFLLDPVVAPHPGSDRVAYGFPDLGNGVKVAWHHQGDHTTADDVRRTVDAAEIDEIRDVLRRFMPDANGSWIKSAVCLYTNTPDLDFLIDRHPAHPQVLIASPCSGHGFKFAPAIGDILADLAIDGRTAFDLTPFRIDRFSKM
jgi:sarcosine oxidase